jgi:predicted ATPase
LLEKVAQAEHLAIWSAVNELRYLFRHALLRDAAYRMQVHARRRSLHGVAVEALEVLYEGHLGPHYGELAYHAEEAGAIDKARKYLESAGEAAKEAYQNSLAEDYFNRALKLTPDEDLEARYRLLLAREQVFQRQGARQEQLQDLEEMAKLAELLQDIEKQIKVLVLRAWVFWWM